MPDTNDLVFRFTSSVTGLSQLEEQSPPIAVFEVLQVNGREALSDLYVFDIELFSEDPFIDGFKLINKRATLEIDYKDDTAKYQGIVASFEEEARGRYRAILVPQLWTAGLTKQCQIFQEKDLATIVTNVLEENGLKEGDDFSVTLKGKHPKHDYIVQYEETDLNFIRRLMEHEGAYFWFEHGEDKEKLIVRDVKVAHTKFRDDDEVLFRNPGFVADVEIISSMKAHHRVLPQKVILKDYNYRKPSLEIKAQADAVKAGSGFVMEYGNHFKTPEEGNELALVRADEIKCRETVYTGSGACRRFHPGFKFQLKDDLKIWRHETLELVLVSVNHFGQQEFVARGGERREAPARTTYHNTFEAITSDLQFRPERKTPKPRLHGVMHAKVDAAGSGEYAEIDDQGRYKVKLPFDLSDASQGKASKFIRMAQPYSGADYGMHFPLHKDVEVILTHVDGDLDRPIINASVPNPETASPIKNANQSKSAIRTAAGNEMIIEDTSGSEQIRLFSPHATTEMTMGGPGSGFEFTTEADYKADVEKKFIVEVGTDYNLTVEKGDRTEKVEKGNYKLGVKKDWEITVEGTKKEEVKHESEFVKVGTSFEKKISEDIALTLGFKQEVALAHTISVTGGMSTSIWRGAKYEDSRGPVYALKPKEDLKLWGRLKESVKAIAGMHVDVVREIRGQHKLRGMKKLDVQAEKVSEKFDKQELTVDEMRAKLGKLEQKGEKKKEEFTNMTSNANIWRAKCKLEVNNGVFTVKK